MVEENISSIKRNKEFRKLIEEDEIAVLLGCYDALTANIVEKTGFNAAYISGAGISNTRLGIADVGLTTLSEMKDQIQYITDSVSIPVFSDADTGYGNALHVRRTVKAYEKVGASGLHIEDQDFPKKCGHFEGKELIPTSEMEMKIKAAIDAREDPNFIIAARTDARAVEGVEGAIERANLYAEKGADLIFPEAPQNKEEMKKFCEEINSPVMANMVEYGKTPLMSKDKLEKIGFDLVIFPNSILRRGMVSMLETAEHIKQEGTTADIEEKIASFDLRNELTDYEYIKNLEEKYE